MFSSLSDVKRWSVGGAHPRCDELGLSVALIRSYRGLQAAAPGFTAHQRISPGHPSQITQIRSNELTKDKRSKALR